MSGITHNLSLFALFAAVFCLALVLHKRRRRSWIERALGGAVPPSRLEAALKGREPVSLEPVARVVSVMFVDIVGYSRAAEAQTPREAFGRLKKLVGEISGVVHKHGGVVEKTIGEGMLCFFGYQYDGHAQKKDHADQAVRCALEIQRENLTSNLEAYANGEPVFPLRIGINTASVYLGDLGNGQRADLTLIGHGVNYAKRLESACEPYRVMVGAATRDLLADAELIAMKPAKRLFQFKDAGGLIEAYELDPVAGDEDRRKRAIAAHREFTRLLRKDTRWEVPPDVRITAHGNWTSGRLVNFSESGIALSVDRYLARGVSVSITLDSNKGLEERLLALGLLPLVGEVRWGRSTEGGGFVLGFRIENLSDEQRQRLVAELRAQVGGVFPRAA